MKPKFGGSGTLYLTVIIITAFLTGGCGVSGGGGSSGGGGGGGGGTTTGTPPDINVSASQLLFGGIVFNSGIDLKNFADRTITIQNKGTLDLNIGQIAWADPLAPPFRITTDNCSMQTLASLQTCTFQVRFAPTDQGSFNDTFDIPSNDPDENPVTVTVSGDGKGLNVSINQVSTNCPNPSPTVTLYITVSDEDGDPLAPLLTKANFSLFENSVPIAPGDIVFKVPSTLDLPKSIALVLDISASMDLRDAITAMQAAAVDFIDQLDFNPPDPDEAEIIRFAKSIEPVPAPVFTSNAVTLKAAINADPKINPVDFRDGTAMYDAVERAVADTAAQGPGRRRAVVVIADGRDNSSFIELNELIEQALDDGVPVFTIGLGDVNAETMQQLADETGGQYYFAPDKTKLQEIYDQISAIISSQYVLAYDSSSTCGDLISLDVVVDDGSGLQGDDSRDITLN